MGEKAIKVCLTNRGKDTETPWAHDLGAAAGPPGSRLVRLVNVPFMHAKPTWGDSIVVSPVDGVLTWDRDGVAWAKIATRIAEDSGRWAMIVDFAGAADAAAFAKAGALREVICEIAWIPRDNEQGRVFLAVPAGMTDAAVMAHMRGALPGADLVQIHPEPVSAEPLTAAAEQKLARRAQVAAVAKPKRAGAAKPERAATAKPKPKADPAAKARPATKPKTRR